MFFWSLYNVSYGFIAILAFSFSFIVHICFDVVFSTWVIKSIGDDMEDEKNCEQCGSKMIMMYGCGWDYDRWLCPQIKCEFEIELETSSMP